MIFGVFVLLAVLGVLMIIHAAAAGRKTLSCPQYYDDNADEDSREAYQIIQWKGETYEYREDLINILCLGVDGRERAVENTAIGFGPKADAIYLAVLDMEENSVRFINISRDTMAYVRIYDSLGTDMGLFRTQIALQYANGDGLNQSCERTASTVSRLLGGIPIHGYGALYWSAVKPLTDAVGPVPAYVPEYMTWVNPPVFHESGYVELDGRQAVEYVRGRDVNIPGSNEERTGYQMDFLQSLVQVTKQKVMKNPLMVWKIRESIKDYLVTDLDTKEILTLAAFICRCNLDELDIRQLPGESREGMAHDEFWADEEGKEELLLDMFYRKIEED